MKQIITPLNINPEVPGSEQSRPEVITVRRERIAFANRKDVLVTRAEFGADVAAYRRAPDDPYPPSGSWEATDVTDTTATLRALVDPLTNDTDVSFRYAPFGESLITAAAAESPLLADTGLASVSAAITGLTPDTYYYFIVRTTSPNVTNSSRSTVFKTLPT